MKDRQRDGASVAVVISSSHIAGTDAFVSPLLSDQDNSIHFVFILFYYLLNSNLLEWIYFESRLLFFSTEYHRTLKTEAKSLCTQEENAAPSTQSTSSVEHIYTI